MTASEVLTAYMALSHDEWWVIVAGGTEEGMTFYMYPDDFAGFMSYPPKVLTVTTASMEEVWAVDGRQEVYTFNRITGRMRGAAPQFEVAEMIIPCDWAHSLEKDK
jgi:hypothetical protein